MLLGLQWTLLSALPALWAPICCQRLRKFFCQPYHCEHWSVTPHQKHLVFLQLSYFLITVHSPPTNIIHDTLCVCVIPSSFSSSSFLFFLLLYDSRAFRVHGAPEIAPGGGKGPFSIEKSAHLSLWCRMCSRGRKRGRHRVREWWRGVNLWFTRHCGKGSTESQGRQEHWVVDEPEDGWE